MREPPFARLGVLSLAAAAAVCAGCDVPRSNPQLARIDANVDSESGRASVAFEYDRDGFPVHIEKEQSGSGVTESWELRWEDGLLVHIEGVWSAIPLEADVEHDAHGRPSRVRIAFDTPSLQSGRIDFVYDDEKDGALAAIETDIEGQKSDIEYTTDDEGKIVAVERDGWSFDGQPSGRWRYGYQRGVLAAASDRGRALAFERDDFGRLERTVLQTDLDEASGGGTEVTKLSYARDGLVDGWRTVATYAGDLVWSTDATLTYADADARGLDMSPTVLGWWSDPKGHAFATFTDPPAQVLRQLFLLW